MHVDVEAGLNWHKLWQLIDLSPLFNLTVVIRGWETVLWLYHF